ARASARRRSLSRAAPRLVVRMRDLPRKLSIDELAELFEGRTRFVERLAAMSERSRREQGTDDHPAVLAELAELNAEYERRFGFRFVVFVNGRPRREIVPELRERLERTREEELTTAVGELVDIAVSRWRAS